MMRLIIPEKAKLMEVICEALSSQGSKFTFIETGKDTDEKKVTRSVGYYWSEADQTAVASSVGHILDLPEPVTKHQGWHMADLPLMFDVADGYVIPPQFKARHAMFSALLKRATTVINAGDTDSEGQALVDNILRYHKYQGKVYRLWAENETVDGFKKAFANLKDNADYEYLGWQGVARAISDKAVGYNLTRVVTLVERSKGQNETFHVGRVKTPMLGLVVRRDLAHENHKASFYYTITGTLTYPSGTYETAFTPNENTTLLVDEKNHLVNKEEVERFTQRLNSLTCFPIVDYQIKTKKQNAPLPFNANTLQQEANKKLGLSPDETMDLAQQLKDAGYISYHRTDCEYISTDDHAKVLAVVTDIINQRYNHIAPHLNPNRLGRMVNDEARSQMAHSAIMPLVIPPQSLDKQQLQLWELIAERFIANYANPYASKDSKLFLNADNQGFLTISSRELIDLGYKHVLGHTADDLTSALSVADIHALGQNPLTKPQLESKQVKTQPPAYYSVATFLEDVATAGKYSKNPEIRDYFRTLITKGQGRQIGGLGTSATVMSIYKELIAGGYLSLKGKTLNATDKGKQLIALLDDNLTYPDLTALWHIEQQKIKDKKDVENFVEGTYSRYIIPFLEIIKLGYVAPKSVSCPKCQGTMEQKKGTSKAGKSYSLFSCLSCSHSVWAKRDNPDEPDFDNPCKK